MPNVYTSAKLTLQTAGTVYNCYTLLKTIDSETPIRGANLVFSADDSNVMSIYMGDRALSSTRYGFEIMPQISSGGGSARVQLAHERNIFTLKDINFMCITQSQNVIANVWTA